jgi:hypothetical protein
MSALKPLAEVQALATAPAHSPLDEALPPWAAWST